MDFPFTFLRNHKHSFSFCFVKLSLTSTLKSDEAHLTSQIKCNSCNNDITYCLLCGRKNGSYEGVHMSEMY